MVVVRIAPSRIRGGGNGLFATQDIKSGTVIRVEHGDSIDTPSDDVGYNLNFFVADGMDPASPCVFDNRVTRLDRVWSRLARSAFVPSYVLAPSSDPLMIANDAGWPARNEGEYESQCIAKNTLEFVLSFDSAGLVDGVFGYFNRDVFQDEEICVTYGWNFWIES